MCSDCEPNKKKSRRSFQLPNQNDEGEYLAKKLSGPEKLSST